MHLRTIAFCSILCIGLNIEIHAKGDDTLKSRFFEEAPKAWENSEQNMRIGTGEITLKVFVRDKDIIKPGLEEHYQYYRNGDRIRFDVFDIRKSNLRFAVLTGQKYGAYLRRNSSSESLQAKWIGTAAEAREKLDKSTYFLSAIRSGRQLMGKPLIEFLNHPNFRIRGIEQILVDGESLVHVKFECNTKDPDFRILDGSITLSPSHDWNILESEYVTDVSRKWCHRNKNVFVRNSKDNFIIKSADYYTYSFESRFEDHMLFEFLNISFDSPSDSKFTLTDYGFPEPSLPMRTQYGSTIHLWLFAGAIALFGVAISLNRAARRAA